MQPTTVSTSSILSTIDPLGWPEAIVNRRAVFVHLRVGDDFRRIADMRAVDFAQLGCIGFLLLAGLRTGRRRDLSMKSSKLVSWRRPYWRRNSLKRGTPCSRSRIISSAAISICCVGLSSRGSLMFCMKLRDDCAASAVPAAAGPCSGPSWRARRAHGVGGLAFEGVDHRQPSATIWLGSLSIGGYSIRSGIRACSR